MEIKLNPISLFYGLWQELEETFWKRKYEEGLAYQISKQIAKLQLSQYGIGSKAEKQMN